jgi:hypothetical protein
LVDAQRAGEEVGRLLGFSGLLRVPIFPFVIIYLNRKLPRAARPSWYHTVILLLVAVFFGFFFVNFVTEFFFQVPLVTF